MLPYGNIGQKIGQTSSATRRKGSDARHLEEGLEEMLTVKHLVDGQERIYLAPHGVTYVGPLSHTGIGGPHLSIPEVPESADQAMGIPCKALHRGFVYVMNPAGATVGSYALGEPPEYGSAAKPANTTTLRSA